MVLTLNNNYILRMEHRLKDTDDVEIEIYAENLTDALTQFKEHKEFLKGEGLL